MGNKCVCDLSVVTIKKIPSIIAPITLKIYKRNYWNLTIKFCLPVIVGTESKDSAGPQINQSTLEDLKIVDNQEKYRLEF